MKAIFHDNTLVSTSVNLARVADDGPLSRTGRHAPSGRHLCQSLQLLLLFRRTHITASQTRSDSVPYHMHTL